MARIARAVLSATLAVALVVIVGPIAPAAAATTPVGNTMPNIGVRGATSLPQGWEPPISFKQSRDRRAQQYPKQEAREAAADRIKLQKAMVASQQAAAGIVSPLAAPAPGPGGVPDYVGDANWAFTPKIRKFVDTLPSWGPTKKNNLDNYLAVAHPDTITYPGSDYYEIELRQYTQKMSSDLPATTLRGYVQVNNGTDANGHNTVAPDALMYLGPTIFATKDRPVRIKFTNKLPTGAGGDLFLPVDRTIMGAGEGPLGAAAPDYTSNRGNIHLHGGKTVWISDGTPHQWITPAGENTPYPKGVSVRNVPDMPDPGDGSVTLFYSNQQSARLLWYHDHSFGITRLNVYAGEAAPYAVEDDTEVQLMADGTIPGHDDEIPLVLQDKTWVDPSTIETTDPTWNDGTTPGTPHAGDLWLPHVYEPNQNPYDITGTNPMGRWHYGPWFFPPTQNITYGPVDNPYYDPVNAPWEPPMIPGVPNSSMTGEAFMDTPIVNGVPYPTLTVDPKAYRFRILNAANDRMFNLSLVQADTSTVTADNRHDTEVKMVPASVCNLSLPAGWPTDGRDGGVPDPAALGPDWVQIGTESGFLPAPVSIPAAPITYVTNPAAFNWGNVTDGSLMLGTAERADVIVDFSQYAGKTLIVYNDGPAPWPAGDPRLDYYTGAPDQSDTGGTTGTDAGYGPNTRTIMQIKVADKTPAQQFDTAALATKWAATSNTEGVFQRSQDDIIVGQEAYNSAYATSFPTTWPNWGYPRIQDWDMNIYTPQGNVINMNLEPKAIHDEMGAVFDTEYGRMSGKLGSEIPNTTALTQNMIPLNFIDPPNENLTDVMTPVTTLGDGTQIWKISQNGVDTHTIHFHLFDVQLLDRVGWDGMIMLPKRNELGWKDTIRVNPLETTTVALRPVSPKEKFGVPDSVRPLDPASALGTTGQFSNLDPTTGQAIVPPIVNQLVNFGWEYVWHCHILSHEEMDMMRPITFEVAKDVASAPTLSAQGTTGGTITLNWTDPTPVDAPTTMGNPMNEIGFRIERAPVVGGVVGAFATLKSALANQITTTDLTTSAGNRYAYKVIVYNAAGEVESNIVQVGVMPPASPTNLTVAQGAGPAANLQWSDNATDEAGFSIERSVNNGAWTQLTTVGPKTGTGTVTYSDVTVGVGNNYRYRVRAFAAGTPPVYSVNYTNIAGVTIVTAPAAPDRLTATALTSSILVGWRDRSTNETGFNIYRSLNGTSGWTLVGTAAANATSYSDNRGLVNGTVYYYKVTAYNVAGESAATTVVSARSRATTPAALKRGATQNSGTAR